MGARGAVAKSSAARSKSLPNRINGSENGGGALPLSNMNTEVIKVTESIGYEEAVRRSGEVLLGGGLVAFPTETVYGLGARSDDPAAVARLRKVKSRPTDKAFTLHLGSPELVCRYVPQMSGRGRQMIKKGWPGPITLIFSVDDPSAVPAASKFSSQALEAIYYENTVGIRCPAHPLCQAILDGVDAPIIAASANHNGQPPPVDAESVLKNLDGQIDLLIDAGETRYAKASTIVRITDSGYKLIREGVLDAGIIDRLSTLRILMICTGNTCRSPMAEGLARKILARRLGCEPADLADRGIVVSSAGTSGGFGGASQEAVSVMARREIDLSNHGSTLLIRDLVQAADYIFSMTRSHRDAVLRLDPSAEGRVALVAGDRDVNDPMGSSEKDYEDCANVIEDGLTARLKEIPL